VRSQAANSASTVPGRPYWSRVQPFAIFKTRDDGSLEWIGNAEDLESAKERVEEFGGFWPGPYVIVNEETGERLIIITGDERIH
jgi:hypothetical protein